MQNRINFSQFRQVLHSLENSDVQIRVRAIGEPWGGFSRLILLSDSAMILQTHDDRKIIVNVKNVVEFQIEKQFSGIEANSLYEVVYDHST